MTEETAAEKERRTRWSFSFTADNSWYWRAMRADGTQERSDASLDTLADCLTNAMDHGYVAWARAEERRRNAFGELIE